MRNESIVETFSDVCRVLNYNNTLSDFKESAGLIIMYIVLYVSMTKISCVLLL